MSLFGSNARIGASAASKYEIDKSLRFEYGSSDTAGPYLTKTLGSCNLKTFTISVWIKKCTTPGAEGFADGQTIISNGGGGGGSYNGRLSFDTSDRLNWVQNNPAPTSHIQLQTSRKFRDCSSWYHIVLIQDTTQGASGDRARLYVNGVRETAFDATTYPTQDYDGYFNNNTAHNIGSNAVWGSLSTRYAHFNGYMAEFHFLDGTVKEPSNFGETDASTGEWIPIEYTGGSYGTNGFYLQFLDNSGTTSTTLGKDTSGQGNNWTPSGFSVTAGKEDDSMSDTPTNNFPTLNPGDKSLVGSVFDANLRVTYNYKPASKTFRTTMALPTSGKFYWEWENEETSGNPGRWQTGLVRYTNEAGVLDNQGYNDADYFSVSYGGSTWNGTTHVNPSWSSNPTFYSGERAAIAIDCATGKVWVGKVATGGGTTWYDDDGTTDGDPAGGTNETCTITGFTTGRWMPVIMWHDGGSPVTSSFTSNINFGQHSFLGTPPAGFETLSSANLPDATIKRGDKYFNTVLYTGSGSANHSITGVVFQPDLVWLKSRPDAYSHMLYDAVRGVGKQIYSDLTNAEFTNMNNLYSFNADGFSLAQTSNDDVSNKSGSSFVSWNWKESTSAGFDIVSWTGSDGGGSNTKNISHNLGVIPSFVIVKNRSSAMYWTVKHSSLTSGKILYLNDASNEDGSTGTNNGIIADLDSSSHFTLTRTGNTGNWDQVDKNGDNYVGYVFATVEGYSKFGKYTGNGNADGPYIYTGFRPVFVMLKMFSTTGYNWLIFDNKRIGYNQENHMLLPNENLVEKTTGYGEIDILSNGFKLRSSENDGNKSGDSFVYAAFAETPFKYANAR